jgi:branched-chain amino acid transport system substrate-binding protein
MSNLNEDSQRSETDSSGGIRRRNFLRTAGTGAIAASFAGCTFGSGNGGGSTDGIKVGLLAPLRNVALGRSYEQAGKLLQKQVNDDGGLLGNDIELEIRDSEYTASVAREKYRELTLRENVDACFGIIGSESMQVIFDEIASNEQIFITSGTGDVEFSERIHENPDKYKYIFRSHQAGVTQGLNLAQMHEKLAESEDINSVALLQEDISGYAANGEVFRDNIPDGVSVEVDQKFAAGTQDYRPLLNEASNAGVDFAWTWTSQTGATLINQWAGMQPDFGLGGIVIAASNPNFGNNVEGGEHFLGMTPGCVATYTPTERTTSFHEQHQQMFDELPPFYTGYTTYDAMRSWVEAVKEAGSIQEDDVIPVLEDREFAGTQGTINYLPTSEDADQDDPQFPHDPEYVTDKVVPPGYQWQEVDGEMTQVVTHPEQFADGSYQWPSWINR